MTTINLLPWREQKRSKQNRQLMITGALAWMGCAALVFLAMQFIGAKIDNQRARNAYLQSEIDQLQLVIREIDQLKERKMTCLFEWRSFRNCKPIVRRSCI